MANAELNRLAADAPPEKIISAVNGLLDMMLGNQGVRTLLKGHDGISRDVQTGATTATGLYAVVMQSSGGNHQQIRNAADNADVLTVTDTALVAAPLSSFNGGVNTTTLAAATNITSPAATITALTSTTLTVNGLVQAKLAVAAIASANLALTAAYQAVPGCSVVLTPGHWNVTGCFDFNIVGAADAGQLMIGNILITGGAATILSPLIAIAQTPTAGMRVTVERSWIVQVTASTTVSLRALKSGGAGTSTVEIYSHIQATNA